MLDDDDLGSSNNDFDNSTVKQFTQLLKTPSDSVFDSFHEEPNPRKTTTAFRKNMPVGKSMRDLK